MQAAASDSVSKTPSSSPVPSSCEGYGRDDGGDAAVEELLGVVKFYDAGKGFGFVDPGGGPDVFVHGSVLSRAGLAFLEPGQKVRVMVAQRNRGLQATDIELL